MTTVFASLHFNFNMSELRRRLQPPAPPVPASESDTNQEQRISTRSARRNLFGTSNPEENVKFVQNELAKIASADAKRWNFDFKNDKPLDGKFSWEVTKESAIPVAYKMPRLTARLTQSDASTSTSKEPTERSSRTILSPPPEESRSKSPVKLTTAVPNIIKPVVCKPTVTSTTTAPSVSSSKSTASKGNIQKSKRTTQPRITEYLKTCKRPRPSADSKLEDEAPPVAKRARTST